ncbi:MAG: sulfatase family protein [Solirubrobacterales bacterium]
MARIRSLGRARALAGIALVAIITVIAACADDDRSAESRAGAGGLAAGDRERPNVVVVMTDDQAVDTMRAMPYTRRAIGRKGVKFDNAVVSFPLCCPSRASFLTGQYAHNHGVLDNHEPAGGYAKLESERTLPVWLERAGYRTGFVGKYLNGYGDPDRATEIPPGWSDWYGLPKEGKKRAFDYPLNENGNLIRHGNRESDYKTDLLARTAGRFLDESAEAGAPFFLWVATPAPHIDKDIPRAAERNPQPAPRHLRTYAAERLPQPPSFNERDVRDKPGFVRGLQRLDDRRRRELERVYVSQLESLRAVDDLVRRIVRTLRRRDGLDDTLLVFTSDNGFLRGQHRIASGKAKLYEESIRVPLLVRGPGFPSGRTSSDVVANIDLAPTILELAHAEADIELDGRSLLAAARGERARRAVLLEVFERKADRFAGVRTRRFVYAERGGDLNELYDLRRDPYQLSNRARDPRYAGVRGRLHQRLAALRDCAGASCDA